MPTQEPDSNFVYSRVTSELTSAELESARYNIHARSPFGARVIQAIEDIPNLQVRIFVDDRDVTGVAPPFIQDGITVIELNINPNEVINGRYQDENGNWQEYSLEHVLAHELIHVYDYVTDGDADLSEQETTEFTNPILQDLGDVERPNYNPTDLLESGDPGYDPNPNPGPKFSTFPLPPAIARFAKLWENFLASEASTIDPISPLILDMDGDGVDLVALEDSNVHFDLEDRDFANRTGWTVAGDDDAFLVVDANNNGLIDDITELFGNATTDGFTELSAYDSNSDDLINASDDDFDDLLVWNDADGDGVADDGELLTLTQAGITEIDMDATSVDYDIEGHNVSHESTFTIDGNTRDVLDVWFEHNTMDTVYQGTEIDDLASVTNAELPILKGGGTLHDTLTAITDDSTLKTPFEAMIDDHGTLAGFTDFVFELEDFMYEWAGVDGVAANSRGEHVNGQKLAFLEVLVGQDYDSPNGGNDPTSSNAGDFLDGMFDQALADYAIRLMAQTDPDLKEVLNYDFHNDVVTINTDSTTDLDNNAPSGTHDAALYWLFLSHATGTPEVMAHVGDKILANASEYTQAEEDFFSSYIGTTSGDTVSALKFRSGTLHGGDDIDTLNDYWGESTLHGGAGDDFLYGRAGNDILVGGAGDDTLKGGADDDTYIFNSGDGDDRIDDSTGFNRIYFGDGISVSDVSYDRTGTYDYEITIGTGGDRILLDDYYFGLDYTISEVVFEDGTVHDLEFLLATANTQTGTSGNNTLNGSNNVDDVLHGLGGNDTLRGYSGNDFIYGGAGTDTIWGGDGDDYIEAGQGNDSFVWGQNGDDTYVFNSGDGPDTVTDSGGNDKIVLGEGIEVSDVSYSKQSSNLDITIGTGGDKIKVTSVFSSSWATRSIEEIHFADGTIHDLDFIHQQVYTYQGTSGNDTKNGTFTYGDSMYGYDGDDTLKGFSGNDLIDGGNGDDTLMGYQGNDEMYGSAGTDDLDGADDNDELHGGDGNDTLTGGNGVDYLYGDADDDDLDGDAGVDHLFGGDDVDDLDGGAGQDRLHGDAGNDTLDGGADSDYQYGGAGDDTLTYEDIDFWIDGGSGIDTLLVDGIETLSRFKQDSIEIVDMTDSAADDGATLSIIDILGGYADDATLQYRGDSGDDVDVLGDTFTRGTNETHDSLTFAHYTGDSTGAEFLVQVGLDFNGSEVTV